MRGNMNGKTTLGTLSVLPQHLPSSQFIPPNIYFLDFFIISDDNCNLRAISVSTNNSAQGILHKLPATRN